MSAPRKERKLSTRDRNEMRRFRAWLRDKARMTPEALERKWGRYMRGEG